MPGTFGVVGGTLLGGSSATPLTRVQAATGVTVTADTAAHTKGAWTQIIASTSADATLVLLDVSGVGASGVASGTLIDLALGGSGSEVAFLSNLPVGSASAVLGATAAFQVPLPVSVPSGSRISARIQSVVTGGKTATVAVSLLSGGTITPGTLTVLGADTGTSRGTNLGTAWTQIIASTAATYRHLIIVPSASTSSLNSAAVDDVTVGSGGSGSEVEIGSIAVATAATEQVGIPAGRAPWSLYGIFYGAASGSRIVAKRGAGLTSTLDAAIIGVA